MNRLNKTSSDVFKYKWKLPIQPIKAGHYWWQWPEIVCRPGKFLSISERSVFQIIQHIQLDTNDSLELMLAF